MTREAEIAEAVRRNVCRLLDMDPPAEPVKYSGIWVPVPRSILIDAGMLQPWEYPDRNPFPHIDPTPRLTRLLDQAHAAHMRLSDAWFVLRNGLPEQDDW